MILYLVIVTLYSSLMIILLLIGSIEWNIEIFLMDGPHCGVSFVSHAHHASLNFDIRRGLLSFREAHFL